MKNIQLKISDPLQKSNAFTCVLNLPRDINLIPIQHSSYTDNMESFNVRNKKAGKGKTMHTIFYNFKIKYQDGCKG